MQLNTDPKELIKPTSIPPECAPGTPLSPFHAAQTLAEVPPFLDWDITIPSGPLPPSIRVPPSPEKAPFLGEILQLSLPRCIFMVFRVSYKGSTSKSHLAPSPKFRLRTRPLLPPSVLSHQRPPYPQSSARGGTRKRA